ncbi:MAG: prepilin-type N-terminal cleavage/methylation domain-containing protein [bacterium]|nr:prepilin-type N-terminal cleavage/methylation domain-containing protein [bacterium]
MKKSGFTKLELLIGLAILGVVVSISAFIVNGSRAIQRDAKRVSDITVLRSALSQYWLRNASYPEMEKIALGSAESGILGMTTEGFVTSGGGGDVILEFIPMGPKKNELYVYSGSRNGYSIQFTTERDTAFGPKGTYYAHSDGVDNQEIVR